MASPNKAKPAGQQPVTGHPLFPAIVALWFAALIGIGSLVLPQNLYDKLGAALGLGTLGFSARLGIAVVAGVAGGALGMLLARKAAATTHGAGRQARPATAKRAGSPVRPISAMEELGSDRLDQPLTSRQADPITGRRRSLSVTDESGPSEYLAQVPLPGGDSTLDLIGAEQFDDGDTLELDDFEDDIAEQPAPYARTPIDPGNRQMFQPDLSSAPVDPYFTNPDTDWSNTEATKHPFAAPEPAMPLAEAADSAPRPFGAPRAAGFNDSQPAPFAAPPAPSAPSPVSSQPAPFSMPVFTSSSGVAAPAAPVAYQMPQPGGDSALAAAARPAIAPFTMPQAVIAPSEPSMAASQPAPFEQDLPVKAEALSGTALSGMALADLIDRFALALRRADPATLTEAMPDGLRRFAAVADEPATTVQSPAFAAQAASFAAPSDYDAAEPAPSPVSAPEPDSIATLAPSAIGALPAALQPLSFGDSDDGDDDDLAHPFAMPFSLPMASAPIDAEDQAQADAPPAAPFNLSQQFGAATDGEDSEAEQDDAFGSLLAMKSGFGPGREFVRIEDEAETEGGIEPVVVFPGTASPGRAAPAVDGPSRDPATAEPAAPPPFAPPGFGRAPFGQPQQAPSAPGAFGQPASLDRGATEQALRDALAKLQQMSGAA